MAILAKCTNDKISKNLKPLFLNEFNKPPILAQSLH
jgi:hypothetical protein